MTIYSYCRFSELERREAEGGLVAILEPELLAIQTYCLGRQWYLTEAMKDLDVPWNVDFARRDNGARLLSMLRAGDVLLSSSLERIFSSCHDAVSTISRLKDLGVQMHIAQLGGDVTDSLFNVNFERVAKMFSALERRKAAERIKGVKQKQRLQGRYLGGSRPFGYMIHENGRLIENPMEQRVLKKIMVLKRQGKSLRAISSEVSTPIMPISFKTVQRLLQRNGELQ
ncbi:MAG: recombinase family protein [Pseudohongiellaceae bacterium]